jgi:hypothetical protein
MITDATPIDETGAVYRSSELIAFGGYPSIYYNVEVTVFETGDAHAIVDGELDELYFAGDVELDEVINATWDHAVETAFEIYNEKEQNND